MNLEIYNKTKIQPDKDHREFLCFTRKKSWKDVNAVLVVLRSSKEVASLT
jgi:hypothetical protein